MLKILQVLYTLHLLQVVLSFHSVRDARLKQYVISRPTTIFMAGGGEESYQNKVAEVLSNFLSGSAEKEEEDPLGDIDFGAPKLAKKLSLESLAEALDKELCEKEWFVTGNVNPIYFQGKVAFSCKCTFIKWPFIANFVLSSCRQLPI